MINIPLKVTGNQLIQEETVNIASGCSNSVQVTLAIDPASDFADSTLKKRAVFRYYQGSYFISDVDENNHVIVPKFVIAYPYFKVTLRAKNEDKTLTITTNEIQIPVSKSPTLYESTIVDGDVNIRNNDGALAISKSGDVVYINFATAYKTAVDTVIAGTYATASALNLVASDVDSIKEDVIDMSTSISNLQGDIEDLDTTKADKDNVYTKDDIEARLAEKQPVGDYATLENGKIPASQLPSYVDDVLEYASISQFPVQGENGVIYIALDTNKTYRWGGTNYVEISESLALGETASTAYAGDKGKANADTIAVLQEKVTNLEMNKADKTDVVELQSACFNSTEVSTGTQIMWTKFLTFTKNANTTFTFETAKENCLNEYKARITNSGNADIVLTFTGVTNILCNDDNCVILNNTLTLPTGVTIEISVLGGNMVAINFEA